MQITVIQSRIFEIRGLQVMLDFHLAELYEVETKRLKESVKRKYSHNFQQVFQALEMLLDRKQKQDEFGKRRRIGFKQE